MFTYAGTDDIFVAVTDVPYGNRIIDVVRVEGSPWSLGGFGATENGIGSVTPVVRMEIDLVNGTKEPELAENKFKLYPNPTVEEITLDLDLNENSKNVTLLIRDLNGSTIRQMDYENIQKQSFNINTSNLRSGLFILTILTDEGVRSQKFMVMKLR